MITSTPPHQYPAGRNTRVFNLEDLAAGILASCAQELAGYAGEIRPVLSGLLEKAVAWLRQAKTIHDKLEDCYRPYMDFEGLNLLKEKILAEILSSAESR